MKPFETALGLLAPPPNRALRSYQGKTVEFLCELNGRLLLLIGQFTVDPTPGANGLAIRYSGRLYLHDHPATEYVFRATPAHLRSTTPATRPGAKVDFLMEKPLLPRGCGNSDVAAHHSNSTR